MGDFTLITSAPLLLIVLFFMVAFVYASVGFGGGSSYIAILAFFVAALFLFVKRSDAATSAAIIGFYALVISMLAIFASFDFLAEAMNPLIITAGFGI